MIKAVVFDFGGVILRTIDRSFRSQIEEKYGLAKGESEELVFSGPEGEKAQLGEITINQLWATVADKLSLTNDEVKQFESNFWAGDSIDQEMITLIESLKSNYTIAMISNAFDDLHNALHNVYKISHLFEHITVSAIEGVMKPAPGIYTSTLQSIDIEPSESVFIDDFERNVEGAKSVGMNAIHYQYGMGLKEKLVELGVKV